MKVQNKSSKCYSLCTSKVSIRHCLLTCFIVIPLVNCARVNWFDLMYGTTTIFEPANPPGNSRSTVPSDVDYSQIAETPSTIDSSEDVTTELNPENHRSNVTCAECQFICHSRRLCIELHLVCDGINDCDDGSDELKCPNIELMLHPHFVGGCKQLQGCYRSQSCCIRRNFNDPVCKKEEEPFLVFSTLNYLYSANLSDPSKGQVNKTLKRSFNAISAFEYRTFGDLLIWLDPIENTIFTGKVNLAQKHLNEIHGRQVAVRVQHKIRGFVFDWMNYAIIWTDDYGIRSDKIDPVLLSPMNQTKLYRAFEPPYDKPGSIAIDVEKQIIFWVNHGAYPKRPHNFPVFIERINLWGEMKAERIVRKAIHDPVGLVVDTENDKVYWFDGLYRTLNSVTYNGTDHIIFRGSLPAINSIISMDIFSNYLYFTDNTSDAIHRIKIINNTNINVDRLIDVPDGSPTYVRIVDPIKQKLEEREQMSLVVLVRY